MAYEPRTLIRVFCVHRLPTSALEFFPDLQRRKAGSASQDCTRSQRVRASTVARAIGENHCDEPLGAQPVQHFAERAHSGIVQSD
jgi:hypothetical protein